AGFLGGERGLLFGTAASDLQLIELALLFLGTTTCLCLCILGLLGFVRCSALCLLLLLAVFGGFSFRSGSVGGSILFCGLLAGGLFLFVPSGLLLFRLGFDYLAVTLGALDCGFSLRQSLALCGR